MLNPIKLRIFTRAVIVRVNRGEELEAVIDGYTALTDEEKQQLREAVLKELQPEQAAQDVVESVK